MVANAKVELGHLEQRNSEAMSTVSAVNRAKAHHWLGSISGIFNQK